MRAALLGASVTKRIAPRQLLRHLCDVGPMRAHDFKTIFCERPGTEILIVCARVRPPLQSAPSVSRRPLRQGYDYESQFGQIGEQRKLAQLRTATAVSIAGSGSEHGTHLAHSLVFHPEATAHRVYELLNAPVGAPM